MENFGLTIAEGSEITNLTVPSGTAFPANDNVGEMFYRTDLDTMYVRNNTGWEISGSSSKNKNAIINGDFDIWQRGTSGFGAQSYFADRWVQNTVAPYDNTASRQSFTLGQTDVPNNPKYYSRLSLTVNQTSGSNIRQFIEGVENFANENVTVSFYTKCSEVNTGTLYIRQFFGTGGSPSVTVDKFVVIDYTTSWQKITFTTTLDSIAGKTLGTNGDDRLEFILTTELASTAHDIDIAQVQVEKGTVATEFENRSIGEELALCQRYYSFGNTIFFCYGGVGNGGYSAVVYFPMEMRTPPSFISTNVGSSGTFVSNTVNDKHNAIMTLSANVSGQQTINRSWTADAEL